MLSAPSNLLSVANATEVPLSANAAWTGLSESVIPYNSVVLAVKADASGTAYMEFSPNGDNWDSSLSFSVASGVNEVHRLSITRPFYRVRYVNGDTPQGYFRLTSLYGDQAPITSTLNSSIQDDADAMVTRGILMGSTENGKLINVPVTQEGHIEMAIHNPRLPFGSIHTEGLFPIFQADAVYGINEQLTRVTTGYGGSVTEADAQYVLQTSTGVGGNATIQSRKRLRYRPGQGAVGRFTARFTPGVADSFQVAGLGHSEDGLYFGYSGTSFGVLHSYAGKREIQTLNITTAATAAGNPLVVLDGVAQTCRVTNSSNAFRTAYDISTGNYTGWSAEAVGSTVVFLASSAGNKAGAFLYSGLGTISSGTFAETRAGVAATENWIPQNQWNGDIMDGTGSSAMTLDPTKGNVYQIGYQFLGYGTLTFQIESAMNGNNPDWVTVHTVRYPNTYSTPNFRNPSFPLTVSAYSQGSTSNLTVNTASFAGFLEGEKVLNGPKFTYTETSAAVTATAFKALFTIKNSLTFKTKANQCVVNILNLNAAAKHTQPVTIYLLKNADLGGNPNFTQYSTDSCTLYDNAATTATTINNSQILYSLSIADNGQQTISLAPLGIDLQPGESITAAAKTSGGGTASFVSISINTREDQ